MGEVSIIGLDLAKNVFQAHGAGADGSVVFRRKLSRSQLLKFMAAQRPCVVAVDKRTRFIRMKIASRWRGAVRSLLH
ncbi:hypothetical protein Xaut_4813 (plasmid) [Xanthobacter versatilis]|uniref:IS110 family transposase n=1 Tax=Xanthobacter autotrophicus (strain ATCC BAA-1158 / Py2) TaxID=78245 RepID=A7IPT1_XANP2|nr:hypothetical protein Xaut_4813 [Xanthobacter autotrophicus Py2]